MNARSEHSPTCLLRLSTPLALPSDQSIVAYSRAFVHTLEEKVHLDNCFIR